MPRQNVVLLECFFEQSVGQCGSLAFSDHPADGVAAEDVEYDVEVEIGPLTGPSSFVISQIHT